MSIRMDPKLYERLSDHVHAAKKLDRRASYDREVQEAVRRYLSPASANLNPAKEETETSPVPNPPEVQSLIDLIHHALKKGTTPDTIRLAISIGAGMEEAEGAHDHSQQMRDGGRGTVRGRRKRGSTP